MFGWALPVPEAGCTPRAGHDARCRAHYKSLPRGKLDGAILKIDGQPAFDDVEKLVVLISLVSAVLTFDDAGAHDWTIYFADRLIKRFVLAGGGECVGADDLEWASAYG